MTELATQRERRVLLVEDDPPLRALIARLLQGRGFDVWEAPNGVAAVDILRQQPEVTLLISDVVMPQMNGFDLVDKVAQLSPETKVLLISGQADRVDSILGGLRRTGHAFLLKPFTPYQLTQAIDGVLSSMSSADAWAADSAGDRDPAADSSNAEAASEA